MASLHDLRFSPPPNPKSRLRLCIKPCAICIPTTGCCIFVLLGAPSLVVAYNIAKNQNIRCNVSGPKFLWYGSMEWNMEENFSMEWNMEWKIFGMEWKWNGRKFAVWNMEKSSYIPYHALAVASEHLPAIEVAKRKWFLLRMLP